MHLLYALSGSHLHYLENALEPRLYRIRLGVHGHKGFYALVFKLDFSHGDWRLS